MKTSTLCRVIFVAALATTGLGRQTFAQGYPDRSIRLLVPFTPGGGTDILARIVAAKMSESMGRQVVVENRPGGNTLIATEAVVRSTPDGYTLIMQTNNLSANPTLYSGKMTFDTVRDLAPVSLVAGHPHVLVINPAVPANNLREFIALAKAKPGTLTFASAGSGTVNHLCGELLKTLAGIDMIHVPYKGSGSVMPELLGGHVSALFAGMPIVGGYIEEGRLRAIAITTQRRFRGLPIVPTIAESGYPGYDFSSWFGVLAPAGTPPAVIRRLHAEIVKALKDPVIHERLEHYEIFGSTPEQFAALLKMDIEKTAKIIRASGATVD